MSNTYRLILGSKGRAVFPAELRRKLGVAEGDRLTARLVDRGSVLVQSTQALYDELWNGGTPTDAMSSASEALTQWRSVTESARTERIGRHAASAPNGEPNEVGRALLESLGIE